MRAAVLKDRADSAGRARVASGSSWGALEARCRGAVERVASVHCALLVGLANGIVCYGAWSADEGVLGRVLGNMAVGCRSRLLLFGLFGGFLSFVLLSSLLAGLDLGEDGHVVKCECGCGCE